MMMKSRCFAFVCVCIIVLAQGFSHQDLPKRIPGIWKLKIQQTINEAQEEAEDSQTIIDALLKGSVLPQEEESHMPPTTTEEMTTTTKENVLLKLQKDGSLRQCNDEGYQEGKWISGRFNITGTTLRLALDRQYFGPPHDTLLTGSCQEEEEVDNEALGQQENVDGTTTRTNQKVPCKLSFSGSVKAGRFGLPKVDPNFFVDQAVFIGTRETKIIGQFTMEQVLSFEGMIPGLYDDDHKDSNDETVIPSSLLADEQLNGMDNDNGFGGGGAFQ